MSQPEINTTGQLGSAMELRFTNYVKNAFVLALREAFAHEATPVEYRYNSTDKAKSQISIFRAFPKRSDVKFPVILVEVESGDFSISSLSHEESYEIQDGNGLVTDVVYSGVMTIPVALTILTETTTDREKLTDLVAIYTRFVFRDLFYKYNMPYLGLDAGEDGEDTSSANGKVIYKGKVRVRLQTEFAQKVDMSLYAAVNSINLEQVLMGSSATDAQPNTEP
jgi:hypothetical protein